MYFVSFGGPTFEILKHFTIKTNIILSKQKTEMQNAIYIYGLYDVFFLLTTLLLNRNLKMLVL